MGTSETIIQVSGMTCHSCVRHVEQALRGVDGVAKVEVRLREGLALVETTAETPPVADMIAAVEEAGYHAQLSGR